MSVEPTSRRLRFDWSGIDVDDWHPELPEFAAGANAISLLMPHAEPYVISAVRSAAVRIDDADVCDRAHVWAAQEANHHRVHRGFNDRLTAESRVARGLDRIAAFIFARLARRSVAFGVAFAAAFEIIAFCSARWAEAGLRRLFGGADVTAASMFLWHLAEEIEHKGIAHDVFLATPGARRRYPVALAVAFVSLIGFTVVGGISLFLRRRQALNPVRWMRLVAWGFGLAFVLLPVAAASLSRNFHPDDLVDPAWMAGWLREFDVETQTLPLWTHAGTGSHPRARVPG